MCPDCGMPSGHGHDYFCPRRHGRPMTSSADHNERPVTAKEYRWLHSELLRLAGRVDALEKMAVRQASRQGGDADG